MERALTSRAAPSPPAGPRGRGVRVTIDRLEVAHVWVHGTPVNGLPVDADVDAVHVHVAVDPSRIAVDVAGLSLTTRGMPLHADAHGNAEAHIVLPAPSGGEVGAKVIWNGTIAGIPNTSTSSVDGDAIDATIDAPTVAPEAIRALWPASPIDGPASAHVDVHGKLPRLEVHARSTQGDASFDVTGPIVLGVGQTADLHFDARAIDVHTNRLGRPEHAPRGHGRRVARKKRSGGAERQGDDRARGRAGRGLPGPEGEDPGVGLQGADDRAPRRRKHRR